MKRGCKKCSTKEKVRKRNEKKEELDMSDVISVECNNNDSCTGSICHRRREAGRGSWDGGLCREQGSG